MTMNSYYARKEQRGFFREKNALYLILLIVVTFFFVEFGGSRASSTQNSSTTVANSKVSINPTKATLSQMISAALDLSHRASGVIRNVKEQASLGTKIKGTTDEGKEEPVTQADRLSNSVFINGFRSVWPSLAIVSEETDPEPEAIQQPVLNSVTLANDMELDLSRVLVFVDPLDATVEYTEDLLEYVTTMVCITMDGRPLAGIIDRPFRDQTIYGVVPSHEVSGVQVKQRDGKYAGGKGTGVITLSRSHTGSALDVVAEHYPGFVSLPAGGSAYKSMLVVDGSADAYVHVTKIKAWDICAGDALVSAAGGKLTDQDGNLLVYRADNTMFSNGIVSALKDQSWFVEQLHKVPTPKVLLSQMISAALDLSHRASGVIRNVKEQASLGTKIKGTTDEGKEEPVTQADRLSNSVFINGFRSVWPSLAIVSEETDPEPEAIQQPVLNSVTLANDMELDLSRVLVFVDPLDATVEYTEDLLEYVTTMVCITMDGRPLAGIIDRPFFDQTIYGVVPSHEVSGVQVKYRDGKLGGLKKTGVITLSRSHTGSALDVVAEHYPGFTSLPAGGSAYKSMLVVDGTADAYVHVTKIKAWDICAGDAIVSAAGGTLTDTLGNQLYYDKDNTMFEHGLVGALKDHEWFVEQLQE
eukprot:TRINITY_DN2661_c0_g1::TRINITY_DN2661_c0_g1_i1::g.26105::m.26105 TRINITY_DN2661_c0_g1::TRINITY_DN2661_c0_g1_i1::g.26105  ORF type:complete len:641 (-),score=161.93,sp/Q29JH0/IMPA3_DROPS/34.31/6e-51,sp/Q29JH0/IMPA3_DROPS/37.84/1e-48,Inositol_P/PF00459.20/6.7e-38,Inositol_P/PF00459.20/1.1e-38,Rho_RNA_bind/PF07497.7/20,Rho_RNA_bind/PF07497.7/9 TRINITY_DN2661_c0_g1_i1:813-2735(-)